jgi:hypothetical protein
MAKKSNDSKKGIGKISFGTKRTGVAKKHYGPKEQKPKPYRGQGR